jgi:Zn-dependent protease with chaperone function
MQDKIPYPAMPLNADESVIKPSASFKKSVMDVTLAIFTFIVSYMLLLISALAIAAVFALMGGGLIVAVQSFLTLILGGALIISGLLLIYFLVKFIFKKQPIDYSGMVEITRDEQPELFQFIQTITEEVRAPFPKKIYIAADVNAGVFYQSTFWSMFLPVKKSLKIGLGLVNCLNVSEFKAVMAHEFGHFSQRSMKFSSYVYNMNRIIYDMLYENDDYYHTASVIARMHWAVSLGVRMNIYLIQGMQKLLQKLYIFLNKKYLALSREMEFHADAIAAYISGANQCIISLRKIELGHECYTEFFNFLNKLAEDKQRPENIYPHHREAIKWYARNQNLAVDENGMPTLEKQLVAFNNTQIIIKDQWSSHPSSNDREDYLKVLGLDTATIDNSAWDLFTEPESLQKQLTSILYSNMQGPFEVLTTKTVSVKYNDLNRNNSYNPVYKGFYNGRYLTVLDIDEVISNAISTQSIAFDDVFTDDNCNIQALITGLKTDISTIDFIIAGDQINTFDYEGVKYKKENAGDIKLILQKNLQEAEEKLAILDKMAFQFFYNKSASKQNLLNGYKELFEYQQQTQEYIKLYENLLNEINPIFSNMKFADIEVAISAINAREEQLKPILTMFVSDEKYKNVISSDDLKSLNIYLSKNWVYFNHPDYDEPATQLLTHTVNTFYKTVIDHFFAVKKKLTDEQLISAKVEG